MSTPEIQKFNSRYLENRSKEKINNSDLYAGSPMYFYCWGCEINHATLSEDYTTPAPKYCDECQRLVDEGHNIKALRQEAHATAPTN